jgi:cellulose synthase/poly-beta-1,6-N-acetylglucosamine synthase-like glycosyltransferase
MRIREKLLNSRSFYRFVECIPGLISWSIIIMPFVSAVFAPKVAAYFILFYVSYWVILSIFFVVNSTRGFLLAERWQKIDWYAKLNEEFRNKWRKYYYATLIPFCKETERVLVPTIESIVKADYPKDRKILVLSSDFHEPTGSEVAERLAKKYKNDFAYIFTTCHPELPGEIKGKAANENWAGRLLYKKCLELGIDPAYVLVTSSDADMSIPPNYICACVYWLLKQGDEYIHTSILQPAPSDLKNIWETSSLVSIRMIIGYLWRMALPFTPHQFHIFAFYTMTLKMLKDIGFWDPDIIQEDIRTHTKALFRFGEKFRVVPIFCVVEGEPVIGDNVLQTLILFYKQVRRWSWGSCELAYMATGLLKKTNASKLHIILYMLDYLRLHIDWVIISYIPMMGAPILFLINPSFKVSTLGANLPFLLSRILTLGSLLCIVFIIIEFKVLGKPPKGKDKPISRIWQLLRWVALPYIGIFLGSLPALDAQTRLILNKRLAYVVYRKK